MAGIDVRLDLQLLVLGPLAVDCGVQGALECCMAFSIEIVHQRQAFSLVDTREFEKAEPGIVGLDDNTFLRQCDC